MRPRRPIGHTAKAGKGTFSLLREFYGGEQLEIGATLTVADLFKGGDLVNVTGTSMAAATPA